MDGIDVSSWQPGIDLSRVPGGFVIVKLTGGTGYVNPHAGAQVASARRAGKLVGLYHYAHEVGSPGTAAAEAEFFVTQARRLADADTVLVLDWEAPTVIGPGGNVWAKTFLERVKAATGKTPWLYAYTSALSAHPWATVSKAFPLWLAWYGHNRPMHGYATDFRLPFTVPGGFRLVAWQYSQHGRLPGHAGDLDLNKFFGDAAAWRLLARGAPPTPTTTPGGPVEGMSPVPTGTRITQEFGAFPGGYNPAGGHTGRDYGTWSGTNAVARAAGTVLWADWSYKLPGGPQGWAARWFFDLLFGGIIVVIQHDDGLITTYSHMSATHLNPGMRVARGEFVGETGNTGSATSGDHLHFEAMPRNPNYASPTYGRIHPGPYITGAYLTSTAGDTARPSTGGTGTPTEEDWFDMATKEELRAVVREEITNYLRHAKFRAHGDKKDTTLEGLLAWNLFRIREEQGVHRRLLTGLRSVADRVLDRVHPPTPGVAPLEAPRTIESKEA